LQNYLYPYSQLIRFSGDGSMNNNRPPPSHDRNWKILYRAAIFETNRNTVPKRLSAAEQAPLARGRELFQQTGNLEEFEEREEVDIALYCLRAYKNGFWDGEGERSNEGVKTKHHK